MEYLLRCTIKKYFESKIVKTELEAVERLVERHIDRNIITDDNKFDQDQWRRKYTFNIYVDNCIKAHQKIFEHIYDKFSGRHSLPGSKKFMFVDEFDDFCQLAGVFNDQMTT